MAISALLALIAFSPLSELWFVSISALEPGLVAVARTALPLGILLPALTVLVSLYTGRLVHAHQTRAIPESVGLCLLVTVLVFAIGVAAGSLPGVQVTLVALSIGALVQALWLRHRAPTERSHSEG